MKIVIDTNIIFSGLLNTNSVIGDLLLNSKKTLEFYSCDYMRYEIQKHWGKLKSISRLSDEELNDSKFHIFSKIHFINESLIPEPTWIKARSYTSDIDIDDTDFMALTIHLKGNLWTGDKELYNGLKKKGFNKVFNTADLRSYRLKHYHL